MNRAYSRSGIIARLFNTPLAVTPQTAAIVLGAVGQRLDVSQLFVPTDGRALSLGELEERAGSERARITAQGGIDRRARTAPAERLMLVHNGVAHVVVRGETVAENGAIGPMSGFTGYDGIVASVQAADADPSVRGILLDIDSPGGEVSGLYECAAILMARRGTKPMRATIRGSGCSAAYALAACADPGQITLHDLGFAGSIGTLAMHADFSGALDQDGIKVTLFTAGSHKADGNPFEPLPESVAKSIQAMVEIANSRFVAHVVAARGLSADAVIAQQADIFRGEAAVAAGLVDTVMSWQDSMDEFEQLVNGPAPGARGRTAPTGAGSARKGIAMSTQDNAPAADQPGIDEAAIASARAEGRSEGIQAGTTAERERITALAEIDGESSLSADVTEAIAAGTTAGDFALAQARKAKATTTAALAAAKGDAVQPGDMPDASAAAAKGGPADKANRGEAVVAAMRGKHPGLPKQG